MNTYRIHRVDSRGEEYVESYQADRMVHDVGALLLLNKLDVDSDSPSNWDTVLTIPAGLYVRGYRADTTPDPSFDNAVLGRNQGSTSMIDPGQRFIGK